jgi:hypothetical protein
MKILWQFGKKVVRKRKYLRDFDDYLKRKLQSRLKNNNMTGISVSGILVTVCSNVEFTHLRANARDKPRYPGKCGCRAKPSSQLEKERATHITSHSLAN